MVEQCLASAHICMLYHLDMNHHQLIYNIVMSIDSECTKCFMQDAVNQMYNFFFPGVCITHLPLLGLIPHVDHRT